MSKDKEYKDRLHEINLELANQKHMSDSERYEVISKVNALFNGVEVENVE